MRDEAIHCRHRQRALDCCRRGHEDRTQSRFSLAGNDAPDPQMKHFITAIAFLLLATTPAFATVYPDTSLTPGVWRRDITDVCVIHWGLDRRHVTDAMRHQVFSRYGLPWGRHKEFELDHLIARELGGADDILNLWPQSWTGPYNAHMKDRLENQLHREVCSGLLLLSRAQQEIASDWIKAYKKRFESK